MECASASSSMSLTPSELRAQRCSSGSFPLKSLRGRCMSVALLLSLGVAARGALTGMAWAVRGAWQAEQIAELNVQNAGLPCSAVIVSLMIAFAAMLLALSRNGRRGLLPVSLVPKSPSLFRKRSRLWARIVEATEVQERKGSKQPSLAALTWPDTGEAVTMNIIAGLIAGLKLVLGMVAFANIVFNSTDSASSMFATGINAHLMAAVLGVVWSTVCSSMNALVTPQDVPALVLGQLATILQNTVKDQKKVGHTLLAAGWISTLLTGGLLLLLGRLRAGVLLRKLPLPVISGFLAAMGATAIRGALSMLSGVPFGVCLPTDLTAFADWKPWAHLGIGMYGFACVRYLGAWAQPFVKGAQAKALVKPLCLLSPLFAFYLLLFARGHLEEDIDWLRRTGWMYPSLQNRPFYTLWAETLCLDCVEWETLLHPDVAASLLVMAVLTSLSAMLSIISSASSMPSSVGPGKRVDFDKELTVLGGGQLVSGMLTGTLPGFQQVGVSASLLSDGGTHRLSQFVAAGFIAAVFVSGMPVSPYIPKFFLGAIFLNLGVSFCKTHLVDNWGRMSTSSYCSMLAIVLVGLARGLTSAVGVGVLIQFGLMVHQASEVDPVYQCGSSDGGFMSARVRTMEDATRLRWGSERGKLEVMRLQGPIFFGVAPALEDGFEALLTARPWITHFVLDVTRVTQIDDSGARVLAGLVRSGQAAGISRFAVTGASRQVKAALVAEGVAEDQRYECKLLDLEATPPAELFSTLEEALETFEDDLLGTCCSNTTREVPQCPSGAYGACDKVLAEIWSNIVAASSKTTVLHQGEVLNGFGDPVDGLWVLSKGKVAVETMVRERGERVPKVTAKLVAPTAIGLSAFFLRAKRHAFRARVLSETATVLSLTEADLKQLQEKDPCTYASFVAHFASYLLGVEGVHARWRLGLHE
mmetsp:Transcript_23417/g.54501  ORF Transcript_23417/g.54501 Transcript_23417/m.54501 type:complete len:926 (+) Transcript_23417:86-2863(+)